MITIHDVAKMAGTSTATVSHVINGTRFVSDELQKKVKEAMKELNYKPNMMARGLKGGSMKTIGVIVPDCTNTFFSEISRAIDRCCFAKGYNIILCNTDNDIKQQSSYCDMLISKMVDGVIMISSDNSDDDINKLTEASIPVVIADRTVNHKGVDNIIVNNEKGGYDATKYLISLGYTKIACIGGPTFISSSNQRIEGYRKALKESGIEINEDYISHGDFHFAGGNKSVSDYMNLKDRPEAVFATNDMMALGFIDGLKSLKMEVPKDVSVIGFDDVQLARITTPKLTTIAQPLNELAQKATDLILNKVEKTDLNISQIVLDPILVERDSCRKK
ncbi:MAG: LacI family transcriptional regulator [Sphaerochaetaceae bacterium]|jgi:LacI family transcriptional regulator|nr:LacI family transcriptional regulator [Sphaerochaetaceae bacterium]